MKSLLTSLLLMLLLTQVAVAQSANGYGCTPYKLISAATNNSTLVATGKHSVKAWHLTNINAAVRYLKIYDKATAPTCGTDTPKLTIPLQGSAVGASNSLSIDRGIYFESGLGLCIVTGLADNDNTSTAANEQIINLCYD